MSGTVISQALPVLVSPILTRLYSPDDFGVFSFYLGIITILSVLITGKYELAIIIPKENKIAKSLVLLSLAITALISIISFVVILIFDEWLNGQFQLTSDKLWLYLIPPTLLFTGIFQAFNYWANRLGNYKTLAKSRVIKSFVTSLVSVVIGYFIWGRAGLIVGYVSGSFIGVLAFWKNISISFRKEAGAITKADILSAGKKYINFPKFIIPAHLLNTTSSNLPVLLITKFFGLAFSGYYSFIARVILSPMTIITSSFADIFRERASKDFIEKGNCRDVYLKTIKKLIILPILPLVIFFIIAPDLFRVVFGAEWEIAGTYARIMVFMFYFSFIANPLSSVLLIAEKQKYDLAWQATHFVLMVSVLSIGHYFESFPLTITLITIEYSIMYLFNILLSYRLSAGHSN
jgi:O-antigen/teichoic acid export membrane protein